MSRRQGRKLGVSCSALAAGKAVRNVAWPDECALAAIIRKGQLLTPRPESVLRPEDELLAVVHVSQSPQLAALLGKQIKQVRWEGRGCARWIPMSASTGSPVVVEP